MIVTSFRNLYELEDYVLSKQSTIISGMTSNQGDYTGVMADELIKDGFDFAIGFGSWNGKQEPVLIIPNIYIGHVIELMKKWKQEYCIHDGMMICNQDCRIMITQFNKPKFFLSKEDADPNLPFTEVILETGERARFRYA